MNKSEKKDFYRQLFSFAIPIGLQNLMTAMIGASDALMLGRLSQDAVAAVSLANQVSFVMTLFSGAIIGSGNALIAQYWGKGDRKTSQNVFCTMVKFSVGIALIFFALAMFMPRQLMRIFTPDESLISLGASYLKIVSFSYILNAVTQCYFIVMKVEGLAKKSVIISLVTLFGDMFIDFFLIYGKAGLPALGANGSAYSTVAVEMIGLIWCVIISRKGQNMRVDMDGIKWFSPVIVKDMVKISLPMLASGLCWGLSISMHSFIMGHLGSDATAAASIASVAQNMITSFCHGFASGSEIIIGGLLGKNMYDTAKKYGREFFNVATACGIFHCLVLLVLAPLVVAFFKLSDTAKTYLVAMLAFGLLYNFAYSYNTVFTCGVFPAGGDAKYDAVSVFFATWCVALPLALVGAFIFHWGVIPVYCVMCCDEIIKVPWLFRHYKKYKWLQNLTRENV